MAAIETSEAGRRGRPPFWTTPRFRTALLGGIVAAILSAWYRTRFSTDLDDIREWVVMLPALEVVLFGGVCGFTSWWLIGRWLGGPRIWPTLIWGFLSTPFGLVLTVLLANLYSVPRLWIMTGDPVLGFGLWLCSAAFSPAFMIITLEQIGPILNLLWPAGLSLALTGRRLHLAQIRRDRVGGEIPAK